MPEIKLSNITKKYGKTVVVDNLNLDIMDGEYVTMLGPTGAGKTTTLRIIAGLTQQDSGNIFIDGKCVDDLLPEDREIGYLSQTYSLFPKMNVWENTIFGPLVKGWESKKIEIIGKEMLEMVRLMRRSDAYPHELSGGMQQRNALARALSTNAKILLLDEPLRALDARLRLALRFELRKLAKDLGITVVHVTHDQEEALTISDRIVIIREGRVVQVDKPEKIFNEPKNPFVSHFVGESNFIEGTVTGKTDEWTEVKDRTGNVVRAKQSMFNIGEKVVLSIKTDYTIIEKGRKTDMNKFSGKIERTMFYGRYTTFEILLDCGEKAKVKLPTSLGIGFAEGMPVTVTFPMKNFMVFEYPKYGLEKELEVA